MVQNLLDVVQSKATEDREATVEPDVLRPHQSACCSRRNDEWSETGESDNGDTSKQWSTNVEVLLLLGSSANKRDRTHHADSVETSASQNSWSVEHQRRQKSGLGQVESSPESIFWDVAVVY